MNYILNKVFKLNQLLFKQGFRTESVIIWMMFSNRMYYNTSWMNYNLNQVFKLNEL